MTSGKLPQQESLNSPSSANERRRSLIKGGLGAAPVIMTLASRSAFAWHCKSPSGFVSGDVSNRHPSVPDEGTLSPATWKSIAFWPAPFTCNAMTGKWPGFYTTTFDGYKFLAGSINYQTGKKPAVTVHDVMVSGVSAGGGANALGAYILAALMNLKKGTVPAVCLTEDMLFKMFNDCATRGYYLPMPSNPKVQWNAQAIIDYLRNNWLVG
jgi:hypothetical protein